MTSEDLAAQVDHETTITGTAKNGKAGAMIRLDDGIPVYVVGLRQWDGAHYNKTVDVRGMLRAKQPRTLLTDAGEHITGIAEQKLTMVDATWSLSG